MRTRIVVGSLVGAVAVHAALLACGSSSMSTSDGGPMNRFIEAMKDAAGLEVNDAHADDGAVPTCSCPVLPAPAEATFSLRFDRGRGLEDPRQDYSSVTSWSVTPALSIGKPTVSVGGKIAFVSIQGDIFLLNCSGSIDPSKQGFQDSRFGCQLSYVPIDQNASPRGLANGNASFSVTRLTDHELEISIPSMSVSFNNGIDNPPTFTFSDIVFRASDPSAHFISPPHAYRP